jgi:cytoskeleton protein RodZ
MTSMQSPSTDQRPGEPGLFGINLLNMDVSSTGPHGVSFGSRLHAAREAQGLDLEACAHGLKLPARVLRQLERDQYDGIDSKIYLASYIRKYGRHLGINEASIQVELIASSRSNRRWWPPVASLIRASCWIATPRPPPTSC